MSSTTFWRERPPAVTETGIVDLQLQQYLHLFLSLILQRVLSNALECSIDIDILLGRSLIVWDTALAGTPLLCSLFSHLQTAETSFWLPCNL